MTVGTQDLVLGAGISGLACAHALRREGRDVLVVDAAARPGGWVATERTPEGFLFEIGPQGFLDNQPATLALLDDLGLRARVVAADKASKERFLFRDGRLVPFPAGPGEFLRSPILSPRGKLRLLAEPFVLSPAPERDETIAAWARRRFGPEAAAVLFDALTTGIYAGDPERLSIRSCFARLAELEAEGATSVLAGMARGILRRKRTGGPSGSPMASTMLTFRDGMEELPRAIASSLGPALRLSTRVLELRIEDGVWRAGLSTGEEVRARRIFCALPVQAAADLLAPLHIGLSKRIRAIPSAGVAVVCMGYDRADLARPARGFGFLCPAVEGAPILGCLYVHSTFPHEAPEGAVQLRVLIGGTRDPGAVAEAEEALVTRAREFLDPLLGIRCAPRVTRVWRMPACIPQYEVGHGRRLLALAERLQTLPGLHLLGHGYRGVGINECVRDAREIAATARVPRGA